MLLILDHSTAFIMLQALSRQGHVATLQIAEAFSFHTVLSPPAYHRD